MSSRALLLNVNYRPLKVISWERAVNLILAGRAELIEHYDKFVRSSKMSLAWPCVIRLLTKFVDMRTRLPFSRFNVLARDGYKCAYCGHAPKTVHGTPKLSELTIDHVIPRAQSENFKVTLPNGRVLPVTCWQNVVASCRDCNRKKADRTPEQAGMPMLQEPRWPTAMDVLRMTINKVRVPEQWKAWLPAGSEWAGYWDDELDAD